jgi:IclR helix-turn-helix domain
VTTTLGDVHAGFREWLAQPAPELAAPFETVDVALATIVANRLDGDPLWLFLVAPPSGGKTEVIRSLDGVPDVYPLSSLTAQTFASGFERKGVESSLLPKLDGKTIAMKDFGSVLTMYREKRAEILGQLREIYDGGFVKDFGNGKSFRWQGKVGLLAGVTPIIDREYAVNQALGERFLLHHEADQRRTLRLRVAEFLEDGPLVAASVPPTLAEGLAALAELAAMARSPILFDQRGDLEYIPAPEGPGRLGKQFHLLAQALGAVRAEPEISLATYCTVYQVAQDTIPAQRRTMLEVLLDPAHAEPPSTTMVAERTAYPTTTARRYLQELAALRLVDRLTDGPGRPDRWQPSSLLSELLRDTRAPMTGAEYLSSNVSKGVLSG